MQPYYEDSTVRLHHGDCLDVMATLPDNSVDAIVTDPPYGLGFMGKAWDDLPPGLPWAEECLRVLKPGGHLLAFGGTRTWHRLAVAVEDAGLEVRDSIAWLYGSGFPKSLDVSKAIDKAGGNPLAFREFARAYAAAVKASPLTHSDVDRHLGIKSSSCYWAREDHRGGMPPRHHWEAARDLLGLDESFSKLYDEAERAVTGSRHVPVGHAFAGNTYGGDSSNKVVDITAPATPAAQQWQGWGTALKPAFEPIVVARKPLSGTVAANVLAHGTGALNIDGTRVPGEVPSVPQPVFSREMTAGFGASEGRNGDMSAAPAGRWPTNVVLDESQAAALDAEVGTLKSGANPTRRSSDKFRDAYGEFRGQEECTPARGADEGGPSRFFPTFKYAAKAPTRERPKVGDVAHPTVKPLALMQWLVRLVTPPGGVVLEPFAGSGTTVEAALLEGFRCIAIEREADYLPLIEARIARATSSPATDEDAPPTLFDVTA